MRLRTAGAWRGVGGGAIMVTAVIAAAILGAACSSGTSNSDKATTAASFAEADFVFMSASGAASREYAPIARDAGAIVTATRVPASGGSTL